MNKTKAPFPSVVPQPFCRSRFLSRLSVAIALICAFSGCLQTRSDIAEEDEQKKMQSTVTTLQRGHADSEARFDGIDTELREMTGRIETDEHKANVASEKSKTDQAAQQKHLDELTSQMKIFHDSLAKSTQRIDALEKQLAASQDAMSAAANAEKEAKTSKADHFQEGEQHFNAKEWKKAIASYQKYRDANPKGKDLPAATLRMGIAFQELGMKPEAKSFFQEVVEKFPKDKAAKIAASKLKQLKK